VSRYDIGPGLLSETINRHMAFGRTEPLALLSEDQLSFTCLRCGRVLSATEAVLNRTADEVAYSCPDDGAIFATIQESGCGFSEGELRIRVGGEEVDWSDYVKSGREGGG
jgi:hypothetical protein